MILVNGKEVAVVSTRPPMKSFEVEGLGRVGEANLLNAGYDGPYHNLEVGQSCNGWTNNTAFGKREHLRITRVK